MTEETDWIGGQLTSQGVPPDEHKWIERFGCTRTYRELRNAIRNHYRKHYPLTPAARGNINLNPGSGSVSRLCHEPRWPGLSRGHAETVRCVRQTALLRKPPSAVETDNDEIKSVEVLDLRKNSRLVLRGRFFADATELGDLLPLARCEHVVGTEGKRVTGELHMPENASRKTNRRSPCASPSITLMAKTTPSTSQPNTILKTFVPDISPWPGAVGLHLHTPVQRIGQALGLQPHRPTQKRDHQPLDLPSNCRRQKLHAKQRVAGCQPDQLAAK